MDINQVRQEIACLEEQLDAVSMQHRECDKKLQPLGAKKRNKPPEVVAALQLEIDSLRATKQAAISVEKQIKPQLQKLRQELTRLEENIKTKEDLDRRQAERDAKATTQNNGCGKSPSQKRDVTWRI